MVLRPMSQLRRAVLGGLICCLGAMAPAAAGAANATECTRIGLCYWASADFGPAIAEKVAHFRGLLAEQRAKGRATGYLSIPLSSVAGVALD